MASEKQRQAVRISNKTRNNKTPRRINAGRKASENVAEKAHKMMVMRLKYIMANMPDPVFLYKQYGATAYTFPVRVGLTRGKQISSSDRVSMTVSLLTIRDNSCAMDGPAAFTSRIAPYFPEGVCPGKDLFYHENRIISEEVKKTLEEYKDWVSEYMSKCETLLATLYINMGDRAGSQYLKVLSRRFRANWAENINIKSEAKVDANVDGNITFNFTTVPAEVPDNVKDMLKEQ